MNYLQSLVLGLCFLALSPAVSAQKKISVGFAEFQYSPKTCTKRAAINVYQYILNTFNESQRFRVLDRAFDIVVHDELERNMDGKKFINSEIIVDQGRQLGAQWMVTGQIIAATANKMEDGSFETFISFFLKIFDVETGEIIATKNISPVGLQQIDTKALITTFLPDKQAEQLKKAEDIIKKPREFETAMALGYEKIRPHVAAFIRDRFPVELDFYKVDGSGKKAEVLLLGNNRMGLKVGQFFEVYHVKEVKIRGQKKYWEQPIGMLKLIGFEGEFIRFSIYKDDAGVLDYFKRMKENLLVRELKDFHRNLFFRVKHLFTKKRKKKKK